jgi:hypothetical protein
MNRKEEINLLKAGLWKFHESTFERKQMSTTIKRIALVAVAALGLGVVAVAPSQAAPLSVSVAPSATTSAIKTGETATISLTVTGILGAMGDSLTVKGVRTKGASGTVRFNGTSDSQTTRLNVSAANVYSADKIVLDTATTSSPAGVAVRAVVQANFVAPSTAGTYEVTLFTLTGDQGTTATTKDIAPFVWTITVTADSKSADSSSTSYISSGTYTKTVDGDDSVVATKAVGTAAAIAATIKVTQKNATNSATEAMQIYVTGPGFVTAGASDSATVDDSRPTTRVADAAAPTVGAATYFGVYSDGTAGTATITVVGAVSGTVLAVKTVTFSDTKPASVSAVVKKAYIAAGKTTTKVFAVTVKDAAGNAIVDSAATITGTRTDTTTAGKALATADVTFTWDATDKVYYGSVTGASDAKFGAAEYKITATGTDADATEVSTKASVTFSDIVATKVTVSAPATASVGDKITYTFTATEKNGYPVADTTYEGGSANGSVGGIFWNTTATKVPDYTSSSVKPFNSGETITTVSGVATKDIYMPAVSGKVAATWTLAGSATAPVGAVDKSIAGTTITVSTNVVNPGVDAATDAANEAAQAASDATDAALAAADAADAATTAVAALSAQVNKLVAALKAQITTLTNLVLKIQKKVRA